MESTDLAPRPAQPKRSLAFWFVLAAVVAAIYVYREWAGPSLKDQGSNSPVIGQPLLVLDLQGLTGGAKDVSLADLKGKVTLVNFWGVWCPPCRQELPHIAALQRAFAARDDFRLLAVSCASPYEQLSLEELREGTDEFLTEQKLQLPTYADLKGVSRTSVGMVLGTQSLPGYPTTVLLDGQGTIRGVWVGYASGYEKDMKRVIVETLAKQK
ncbi:MAG: TlpA family protein disulfide reductase [Planctomycetia bacterium]|nr:TlpA family protein disulfide reductase [Planctomycetia bacterium]